MKRFDKVITKQGAGGLLKAGLMGVVLIVNGNDIFIRIAGTSWHVKKHQLTLICQHKSLTFNNDAGVNVCDDCNNPIYN